MHFTTFFLTATQTDPENKGSDKNEVEEESNIKKIMMKISFTMNY